MASQGLARWSLQHAKAQFSEVVRRSLGSGPQLVTRNGEDAVVVVSVREYERLTRSRNNRPSFARFLAESPLADAALDFARTKDPGRPVKL